MNKFDNYTNITSLWNDIGIRTRDPITKVPSYFKIAYKPTTYTKCNIQSATGKWKTLVGEPVRELRHNTIAAYKDYVKNSSTYGIDLFGTISPIYQFVAENCSSKVGLEFDNIRTVFIDIEVDSKGGFAAPDNPTKPITAITVEVWGKYLIWACGDYTPDDIDTLYTKCKDENEMLKSFAKWWSSDYPDVITGWNTQFYDIPYITNRIQLLYEKGELSFQSKVLSPWGKLTNRQSVINGQANNVIDILGISILDYLELYRKFSLTQQESYKLDYIAEVELGENKVSYEEYGSLHDLAEQNFQLFVDYNRKDVELVKKLNDKLHHLDLCIKMAYSARINYTDTFRQVRMWDAIIYYDLYNKNIVIPNKIQNTKTSEIAGAYVKDPQIGKHSWLASFDVNSLYPSIMREWNISSDRHLPKEFLKQRLFDLENAHPNVRPEEPTTFDKIDWLKVVVNNNDIPTAIWALSSLLGMINTVQLDQMISELEAADPYPFLRVLGVTISANKQVYRSDSVGFLPIIIARMYDDRKNAKNKEIKLKKKAEQETDKSEKKKLENAASMWGLEQNTLKIGLNSLYGGLSNEYGRWYDNRHAESITLTGQLIIQFVANRVNAFLSKKLGIVHDYVIASDTDSLIVTLGNIVQGNNSTTNVLVDIIDKFCEKELQPVINKAFLDIHFKLNTIEPILVMKREAIAEHGVWTAKKRYILYIHDNEGIKYNPPKLKIVGIEAVRSSTPKYARKVIKAAIEHFVKSDEEAFYNLIEEAEREFGIRSFDEIASPRSVNGLETYPILPNGQFSNKTPVHVKGALVYNKLITDAGLENKYPKIVVSQKIKFCYLQEQNPFKVNVIASPGKLPKELNIEQFLDRYEQFEKTIVGPLNNIVKYANWTVRKQATLF